MKTYGRNFWRQAAERAFKSGAQAIIGAGLLAEPFDVLHFDWQLGLGAVVGGALLSLATSIVTAPVGPTDTPSVVGPTVP
jgi:hypothetical protein